MIQKYDYHLRKGTYTIFCSLGCYWCLEGTNRQRLYEELGWESLYHRRWYRRLCHFIKLVKSRSPDNWFDEIPLEGQVSYSLRNAHDYEIHAPRTSSFSNTYNTLFEWNLLEEEVKHSVSLFQFISKLLKLIGPQKRSTYNICDIDGVGYLTKLRLNLVG